MYQNLTYVASGAAPSRRQTAPPIQSGQIPKIQVPDLQVHPVNTAFAFTPTLLEDPVGGGTWSGEEGQAPGLSINPTTGEVTGTPTQSGNNFVELRYSTGAESYHRVVLPIFCHNGTVVTIDNTFLDRENNVAYQGTGTELDPWTWAEPLSLDGNDFGIFRLDGWCRFDTIGMIRHDHSLLDLNDYGVMYDYISTQEHDLPNRDFSNGFTGWTTDAVTHNIITNGRPAPDRSATRIGGSSWNVSIPSGQTIRLTPTTTIDLIQDVRYAVMFSGCSANEDKSFTCRIVAGSNDSNLVGTLVFGGAGRGWASTNFGFDAAVTEVGQSVDIYLTNNDAATQEFRISHVDFAREQIGGIVTSAFGWAYPDYIMDGKPNAGTGNDVCALMNGEVRQVGRGAYKNSSIHTNYLFNAPHYDIIHNVTIQQNNEHNFEYCRHIGYGEGYLINKCTFKKNNNYKTLNNRDYYHGATIGYWQPNRLPVQVVQGCVWEDFTLCAMLGSSSDPADGVISYIAPIMDQCVINGIDSNFNTNNFTTIQGSDTNPSIGRSSFSWNVISGPDGTCHSRGIRPRNKTDHFANIISVQDIGGNSEYYNTGALGHSLGGCYAIQMESTGEGVYFYENDWKVTDIGAGGGLIRINGAIVSGGNVSWKRDKFTYTGGGNVDTSSTPDLFKIATHATNPTYWDGVTLEDCEIISDGVFSSMEKGDGIGYGTLTLTNCTYTWSGVEDPLWGRNDPDVILIDNTGETWTDESTRIRMQSMYAANPYINGSYPVAYVSPASYALDDATDTTGGVKLADLSVEGGYDPLVLSILTQPPAGAFSIQSGNELWFDHGVLNKASVGSYDCVIRVTDQGNANATYDEPFSLNVSSLTPPSIIGSVAITEDHYDPYTVDLSTHIEGDLLVVVIKNGDGQEQTWIPPAGWTQKYWGGGYLTSSVFTKIAGVGGEGATAQWDTGNGDNGWAGQFCLTVRGASEDSVRVSRSTSGYTTATVDIVSNNSLAIQWFLTPQSDATVDPPAGYTVVSGMPMTHYQLAANAGWRGVNAGTLPQETWTLTSGNPNFKTMLAMTIGPE